MARDAAATVLFTLIVAAIGTSVLTTSWAMLVSGLFARWLCWLGVIAGALIVVGGIVATPGAGDTGSLHDLGELLIGAASGSVLALEAPDVDRALPSPGRRRRAPWAAGV